jgi:hypothetical protein
MQQSHSDIVMAIPSISNVDQSLRCSSKSLLALKDGTHGCGPAFLYEIEITQAIGTQQNNALLLQNQSLGLEIEPVGWVHAQGLSQSADTTILQDLAIKAMA